MEQYKKNCKYKYTFFQTSTQLSKHPHINTHSHIKIPINTHTHTLQKPHIHTPTHYKSHTYTTHTLQNPQYTHTHTLQNSHVMKSAKLNLLEPSGSLQSVTVCFTFTTILNLLYVDIVDTH